MRQRACSLAFDQPRPTETTVRPSLQAGGRRFEPGTLHQYPSAFPAPPHGGVWTPPTSQAIVTSNGVPLRPGLVACRLRGASRGDLGAGTGGRGLGRGSGPRSSADVFDDLDELVEAVALAAGEVDELLGSLDDGAAFGCSRDRMPRPRRNSSSPSSRSTRSERSTVLVLTPRTAARSLAGGSRSPGFASPSAIARRISPATCS